MLICCRLQCSCCTLSPDHWLLRSLHLWLLWPVCPVAAAAAGGALSSNTFLDDGALQSTRHNCSLAHLLVCSLACLLACLPTFPLAFAGLLVCSLTGAYSAAAALCPRSAGYCGHCACACYGLSAPVAAAAAFARLLACLFARLLCSLARVLTCWRVQCGAAGLCP